MNNQGCDYYLVVEVSVIAGCLSGLLLIPLYLDLLLFKNPINGVNKFSGLGK